MSKTLANSICAILLLISIVAIAMLYPQLPEQLPTHWNAAGEIDQYSDKWFGVLIGPGTALFVWVLMLLVPAISPKGFGTSEFAPTLNLLQVVLVAFMLGIGAITIMAGLGHPIAVEQAIPFAVGTLFVVLGNFFGKLRKNFFIGIRTPWTLASDEVWMRTHRLGGYVFVTTGLATMAMSLFGFHLGLFGVIVSITVLVPILYSYLLYRQLEGFESA
ncbi:MAG: SdpI family protein [Pseudomonadota bacterium]